MKTFEDWLKAEGLDAFPGVGPALVNAMRRGWNADRESAGPGVRRERQLTGHFRAACPTPYDGFI